MGMDPGARSKMCSVWPCYVFLQEDTTYQLHVSCDLRVVPEISKDQVRWQSPFLVPKPQACLKGSPEDTTTCCPKELWLSTSCSLHSPSLRHLLLPRQPHACTLHPGLIPSSGHQPRLIPSALHLPINTVFLLPVCLSVGLSVSLLAYLIQRLFLSPRPSVLSLLSLLFVPVCLCYCHLVSLCLCLCLISNYPNAISTCLCLYFYLSVSVAVSIYFCLSLSPSGPSPLPLCYLEHAVCQSSCLSQCRVPQPHLSAHYGQLSSGHSVWWTLQSCRSCPLQADTLWLPGRAHREAM